MKVLEGRTLTTVQNLNRKDLTGIPHFYTQHSACIVVLFGFESYMDLNSIWI